MNTFEWRIGCSGFYYKEWKEILYPKGLPQSKWFAYYCQHFSTLEINNTFYRFPELKALQNWYAKSPPDFIFSVKAPQIITHQKKFLDTGELLKQFYEVVLQGLREKAGPILFQLPPKLSFTPEMLKTILQQTDAGFTNVIEFRHSSWWCKEVFDALSHHHITFCGVSYPGITDEVVVTTPVVYYRFHGVPRLYYSAYETSFLQNIVAAVSQNNSVRKAFLYFNNTASAAALDNARFVQQITASAI